MTVACKAHYESLHKACGAVLSQSFEGVHAEAMAASHAFIADLDVWLLEIKARSEASVHHAAAREYQLSVLALSRGHYRAAFSSLRLSLELTLAAVRWSASERELREWKRGTRDSAWNDLIDKDSGVLSAAFVSLFTDALVDEAARYRASAAAVYRECSEYVHGNAHTHDFLPATLTFAAEPFRAWHQKASVVRLVISFVLAARYLCDLPADSRSRLESVLTAHLGHSPAIRALLGAPVEASDE